MRSTRRSIETSQHLSSQKSKTLQVFWDRLDSMDASLSSSLHYISQQLTSLSTEVHDNMAQCHSSLPPLPPGFDASWICFYEIELNIFNTCGLILVFECFQICFFFYDICLDKFFVGIFSLVIEDHMVRCSFLS